MKKYSVPIVILSVILLLLANFSFWLSSTLYNPQNFSNLVVQTYEQPEVRNAIAAEVVDTSLQSKPLVKQVIGDPVQNAIAGILGSQTFKSVLTNVATKFQNYLTQNNQQDVTIQIGQVSTFIKLAATTISPELGAQLPDTTPQTITLVKSNSLPNVNKWLKPIMTIGPIAGLIGLLLLVYEIYAAEDKGRVLKRIGLYLLIGAFIFMLTVPYFRTLLQGSITDQNAEVVATATFDTFANVLLKQLAYIILASAGLYIVGLFIDKNKNQIIEEK